VAPEGRTAEPEPEPEWDDQAYFHAIEESFVRLRGTPLLLSPADWHVARRWHRDGVPLDLVRSALEGVFARRRERGLKGKVSSLRYCASAIELAWDHLRELTAPGDRERAPAMGFDIPLRLRALAAALPARLAEREVWAEQICALEAVGGGAGGSQAVEEGLADLDRELLDAATARQTAAARREVEATVERTLATLAGRIPDEELARSHDQLRRQILRKRLKLPVLSLFSPEAESAPQSDLE
jgi:hypothetical protein